MNTFLKTLVPIAFVAAACYLARIDLFVCILALIGGAWCYVFYEYSYPSD